MINKEVLKEYIQDQINTIQTQINTQNNLGTLVYHEYVGMLTALEKLQLFLATQKEIFCFTPPRVDNMK